jgi:hypothetical protein
MRFKLSVLATSIALGSSLFLAQSAFAQSVAPLAAGASGAGFEASFSGKTISPVDTVSLVFPGAVNAGDGQFAVIVGTEDLTANFRWISPTQLEGVFAAMPLPTGVNALRVFQIAAGNQWVEIGQAQITVQAAAGSATDGSKPGMIKPSLIVGLKSQLAESHSAAAAPPLRRTYADLTAQAGLQTEHGGADWSLKSQINLVGSSFQPEAVDFANQGQDAPKLDIANYLVESSFTTGAGITALSIGHVQAGNHPLLATGIANRGLTMTHKFNQRFDMAASLQNGNAVVGGNNILGLNDNEHRMTSASAGIEMMERPAGLRFETTLFQGVIKPKLTTGIATLQDAEQSRGWGLRAKSQNAEGSLRADIAFARSTYTPKGDSSLSILPGPSTSGSTWYADLGYDVVKNAPLFKDYPLSLTLQAKHEQASATYKSLGAAGQAGNYASNSVGLSASLGVINGQLQLGKRADNVDDNIAFLKNRANTLNLTLAAPLAQILDTAAPPVWAPNLSYNFGRNASFADTAFIPSGQTLANLPNVRATTHGLGLNWVLGKLTFGYQLSKTLQDNEQVGQERQDVADLGHNITAAYQFSDRLNLSGGLGKRTSVQKFTGVEGYGNTMQGAVNWFFADRYTLSSNFSTSKDRNSIFTTDSKVLQAQLQLLKQFDVSAFGSKLPGQWSISYTFSNNNSLGTIVRYQTLNTALSLSFL